MMSADDEPSQATNKPAQNTNNLINEAFNLSASSFQPFTVLPPSTNHFQPIQHSRTPSTEIKELPKLGDTKQSLSKNVSPFNPSLFFDQTNKSLASTPQQDNLFQISHTPFENKPADTSTIFSPIPNKQLINLLPNQSAAAQPLAPPPSTGMSNLPPPLSVPPPSALPPPLSKPPSSVITTPSASNPYSAKGALNKKVYDNVIPVAPIPNSNTSPALFMSPPAIQHDPVQQSPQVDMFTPLPKSASNASLNQTFNQPPMYNTALPPPPPPPPTVSTEMLDQRLTTSLSFSADSSSSNMYSNYQNQNEIQQNQQQQQQYQQTQNKTMWNWFTQNKYVNQFVEKAKIGVETIVTTVDPQMKEYIHPANRPFNIVSTISHPKIAHAVRESFSNAGFSKITISAMNAQNSTAFAPQVVGFPCALQSAKDKLENALYSMQQTSDCVVISFQDFLAELSTDCWFELAVIMLKDKTNNIDLTIYTEAVPVSNDDIGQLQQYTPSDFNLAWSGFAVRLPEKNFNFNSSNSTHPSINCFLNYDTNDTVLSNARLSHALHSLAILFKNKLLSQLTK